jgi:ankyrin repeat protein
MGGCVYLWSAQDGFNALLNAAQHGHTATVEALLEKGADVNSQDLVCTPISCPLHPALSCGACVVTTRVADGGPTDSSRIGVFGVAQYGRSALYKAAQAGHTATVTMLPTKGAEVNVRNQVRARCVHGDATWQPYSVHADGG